MALALCGKKNTRDLPYICEGKLRVGLKRDFLRSLARQTLREAAEPPHRPLSVHRDANSSPPLCPNKEEFGVCVGRRTFTHRKLSPVENEGEMWWFNVARAGKWGVFLSAARPSAGGGCAHGCWGGGKPGGDSWDQEPGLARGRALLVSRRGGECKSGDLRSQIKGDVGVIRNFFTRSLRNALPPPPPPLGLFLNRDHLWLIVHIV